jgi:thiamine transporter ThiT
MLLIVGLALRYGKKSPILTGLVMSLFAIKVHLFLLLPLLFLVGAAPFFVPRSNLAWTGVPSALRIGTAA